MYDVVVIGAGFGGMASALALAESGKKVALCEALNYPGGCASTFTRDGYRFEAGATLFSGFAEGQLFQKWIQRHDMKVQFQKLDPSIRFRTPTEEICISPDRDKTIDAFCAIPGAPVRELRRFFSFQKKVADLLWPMFDEPSRLPPMASGDLSWHLQRSWRYPTLLPFLNRSLHSVLSSYGLADWQPFVQYCNALCQITIQADARNAEALFALSTLDYPYRGTGHIHGGIGELGQAMLQAFERCGGEVYMPSRVKACFQTSDGWRVESRKKSFETRQVIANLLPKALSDILPKKKQNRRLYNLSKQVEKSWGAVMLYLAIADHQGLPAEAHHTQAIVTSGEPLNMGHHLFCSVSGRSEQCGPEGQRTATVSTHVPIKRLRSLEPEAQATLIQEIQDRMLGGLKDRVPEVGEHILMKLPASPRTFERFTRRTYGFVGGIPRTKGLHNYKGLFPRPIYKGLWMVGDSVFPGQSTLATAVGGVRTARAVVQSLDASSRIGSFFKLFRGGMKQVKS